MVRKKFLLAFAICLAIIFTATFSYASDGEKNWFQSLISFEWLTNMFSNNQGTAQTQETVNYNLGLEEYRQKGTDGKSYKYEIDSADPGTSRKVVWKVADYQNEGAIERQEARYDKTIYCLRAEYGFFDEANNGNLPTDTRKYDIAFNLKTGKEEIKTYYNNNTSGVLKALEDGTYNKVLWILDNMYVKNVSSDGYKTELLNKAEQYYKNKYADQSVNDETHSSDMTTLTDEDIDVIQQLAIWYYTNSDRATYHRNNYDSQNADIGTYALQTILVTENKGATISDLGKRWNSMRALYEYLIDNAKADYVSSTETVAPIELDKTNKVNIVRNGNNLISGPYKINKKSDLSYILNTVLTDQSNNVISTYKILDKDKKEIASIPVDAEFYVQIADANEAISKVKLSVDADYTLTTSKFLTSSNDTANQQPLVIVEKEDKEYKDEIEVSIQKEFDLALRKYITKVERNGQQVQIPSRVPEIDITNLANGTDTTATYKHRKDPVMVKTGDIVTYIITVYNEGDVQGQVHEIKDLLPEGTEFNPTTDFISKQEVEEYDSHIHSKDKNGVIISKPDENCDICKKALNAKYEYEYDNRTRELKITKWSLYFIDGGNNSLMSLQPFNGTTLDKKSIEVKCKVTESVTQGQEVLTNVARITKYVSGPGGSILSDEINIDDRDSKPEVYPSPSQNELPSYKGKDENKNDLSDKTYFYKGQEDDDDFEKLIIEGEIFDLSLRKFITGINDEEVKDRIPEVDVSKLNTMDTETGKQITTAIYNHSKTPLTVKVGDEVTYTIRVYNEGDIAGYAKEVTDHLPPWLEFIYDDELNTSYGWVLDEADKTLRTVKTTHLSKEADKDNLINAFDGKKLDYKEIKIKCKVKDTAEFNTYITNIADITDFVDKDGKAIIDRDSEKNNVKLPDDKDLPDYKNDKIESGDKYIPGQQDDDDFEKIIIQDFDLALRKFIAKVNDKELKEKDKFTREPIVDATKLNTLDSETEKQITTATYTHPKDTVEVASNDIVIYTLRIYNEGSMSGYANEVVDDVPEGLEFLPDNEINKQYEWKISEDGKKITTEYLSKDNEKEERQNLIKAFDKDKMASPDYKDIQIAFKVTEPNTSDRILVNTAEITKDVDENGKDVEDRDSTPGNNNEWNKEDDLDKEFVKVKYFDLSLKKWVSRVLLIENGEQTVRETGHTGNENPEPIVKVDLHRKKVNSMSVKFVYVIKVTNEGQIPGYAKELTDYIPAGLKFEQADNPIWKEKAAGTITTRALETTLLKPGESANVEVILTWINDGDNMGVKTNIAEISEDYNDSNTPDIDSMPNNKKTGEDDIDDASVMLSVQPGTTQTYITLSGILLATIAGGVMAIKKFVLV